MMDIFLAFIHKRRMLTARRAHGVVGQKPMENFAGRLCRVAYNEATPNITLSDDRGDLRSCAGRDTGDYCMVTAVTAQRSLVTAR